MARVETIVVGGGVAAQSPFELNTVPFIITTDPPAISSANIRVAPSASPPQVFIGERQGLTGSLAVGSTYIGDCTFGANTSGQPCVIIGTQQSVAHFTAPSSGIISIGVANTMVVGTGGNHQGNIVIGFTNSFNANADNASFAVIIGDTNAITADMNAGKIIGRNNAVSFGASLLIFGDNNTVSGNTGGALMFGYNHDNAGNQGVAIHIGSDCNCTAGVGMFRPILIGSTQTISGTGATDCVLIGNTNTVSGNSAAHSLLLTSQVTVSGTSQGIIRLGNAVSAASYNNRFGVIHIGIGTLFDAGDGSIVLGHNPATVTAAGRASLLVLGGTDVDATATGFAIRFTNASGNNVVAGNATITAPRSTGNAVPGRILLQTGVAGASGVTLQTARTSAAVAASVTATETDLLVFDVDNNTLERVTVGAADSGGVGFKVLRIPN